MTGADQDDRADRGQDVAELLEVHRRLRSRARNCQTGGRGRPDLTRLPTRASASALGRQLARGGAEPGIIRRIRRCRPRDQLALGTARRPPHSWQISASCRAQRDLRSYPRARRPWQGPRAIQRRRATAARSGCSPGEIRVLINSGMDSRVPSFAPTRVLSEDISRSRVAALCSRSATCISSRRAPGEPMRENKDSTRQRGLSNSRDTSAPRICRSANPTPPPACARLGGGRCGPRFHRGNGGSAPAPATPRRRPSAQMVWPSTRVVTS